MSREGLQGWLIVVSIIAGYCALGWYGAASKADSVSSSSEPISGYSTADYEDKITEYENALYEANQVISEANSCTDDALSAFDYGDFSEGMSQLDNCRYDEVSEPSSL